MRYFPELELDHWEVSAVLRKEHLRDSFGARALHASTALLYSFLDDATHVWTFRPLVGIQAKLRLVRIQLC